MDVQGGPTGGPDLERLLDELIDLDAEARAKRLAELAIHAPDTVLRLTEWLEAIDNSAGFLEPVAREAPRAGQHTGSWRLLRPIGRGGMGEVWLAERADGAFQRQVAIKFIRTDRPGLDERLTQERHLLARLEHPNIARLIDGGVDAKGRAFLVTEFVDGVALDRWCREQAPTLDARLAVLHQIATAIAYAHALLVAARELVVVIALPQRTHRQQVFQCELPLAWVGVLRRLLVGEVGIDLGLHVRYRAAIEPLTGLLEFVLCDLRRAELAHGVDGGFVGISTCGVDDAREGTLGRDVVASFEFEFAEHACRRRECIRRQPWRLFEYDRGLRDHLARHQRRITPILAEKANQKIACGIIALSHPQRAVALADRDTRLPCVSCWSKMNRKWRRHWPPH